MASEPRIGKNTVLGPRVRLGDGAEVGNNVILEGDINVGSGTRIDHGCVVRGSVTIGENNWIYPYGVIGTGPQHRGFEDSASPDRPAGGSSITIGDNNTIREFATIHRPTVSEKTVIGSCCYIMSYTHMAHDCVIGDNVTISTNTTLGGHVEIRRYANLGQTTTIHPHCKVGAYAMVGMMSSITKDILPFSLMNRQKFTKINRIGLKLNGVAPDDIDAIDGMYRGGLPASDAGEWYAAEVASFVAESKRGYYAPAFAP